MKKEDEENDEEEEESRRWAPRGGGQEYKQETVPGHPASGLLSPFAVFWPDFFVLLFSLLSPFRGPLSFLLPPRTPPLADCARYSN